jgi:hypothetical protein
MLKEQQIKEYLIDRITFWTSEIRRNDEDLFMADFREFEAFRRAYEDMYEKLFGVEDFKRAYQDIYNKVYKNEV